MKNDQDKTSNSITPAQTFNLILVVLGAYRLCILPFIRRGFGPRRFGFPGLMAAVLILVVASRAPAMINFLYVWVGAVILQRIISGVKLGRGWVVHSHYQGAPWLAMKFVRNEKRARGFEPVICFVLGACLLPVSPDVGAFIMLGGLALILYMGVENSLVRARTRNIVDAQIEQRVIGEQLRGQ